MNPKLAEKQSVMLTRHANSPRWRSMANDPPKPGQKIFLHHPELRRGESVSRPEHVSIAIFRPDWPYVAKWWTPAPVGFMPTRPKVGQHSRDYFEDDVEKIK